jgi:hypothetical protein
MKSEAVGREGTYVGSRGWSGRGGSGRSRALEALRNSHRRHPPCLLEKMVCMER